MSVKPIYGVLDTCYVQLPSKTPIANEAGEQVRVATTIFRDAMDFAFRKYRERKNHVPLKSGDLMKVFKTVSDGNILWQGRISLNHDKYRSGTQKGMTHQKWGLMFYDNLPARLERRGKETIFGMLEPYSEQGSGGVMWSLQEYGKISYAGLHRLEKGDKLTVYSKVRDGTVEWEGKLDFGPVAPVQLDHLVTLREVRHMGTRAWRELSWQHRPVILTPKP